MSLPDFVHIYIVFLSTFFILLNHGLKYKYYSSLQNKMHGISYSTCYISPMSFSTYIHSLQGHMLYISYEFLYVHTLLQGHAPDSDNDGALVSCFDLFLRLMREDKWVPAWSICFAATQWRYVYKWSFSVCLFQVQGSAVWGYFCRVCVQEGATVDSTTAGNSEETAANNIVSL